MEMGERMKPKTVPSIFFEIYDTGGAQMSKMHHFGPLTLVAEGPMKLPQLVSCLHFSYLFA